MAEFIRRYLRANNDAREVVIDTNAGYFGTPVNDQSLVPAGASRIGPTRFDEWLSHSKSHA